MSSLVLMFYHVNAGSYTCSLVSAWLSLLFLAVAVLVLVRGASAAYLVYPYYLTCFSYPTFRFR